MDGCWKRLKQSYTTILAPNGTRSCNGTSTAYFTTRLFLAVLVFSNRTIVATGFADFIDIFTNAAIFTCFLVVLGIVLTHVAILTDRLAYLILVFPRCTIFANGLVLLVLMFTTDTIGTRRFGSTGLDFARHTHFTRDLVVWILVLSSRTRFAIVMSTMVSILATTTIFTKTFFIIGGFTTRTDRTTALTNLIQSCLTTCTITTRRPTRGPLDFAICAGKNKIKKVVGKMSFKTKRKRCWRKMWFKKRKCV